MTRKHARYLGLGLAVWAGMLSAPTAAGGTLTTEFTYQGRLRDAGGPVDGTCDFRFRLCDAATLGTQVGTTQSVDDHGVTKGLFTVPLDFGDGAFAGDARWLEVAVREGASTGGYTTLTPRQPLTAAPYALCALTALEARAVQWPGVLGAPPIVSSLDGVSHDGGDIDLVAGPGIAITPDDTANSITIEATGGVAPYWSLSGNAGTSPPGEFLGTTDPVAVYFRVGNVHALRLEPGTPPSVIGGYVGNAVAEPVNGGNIGGGGQPGFANRVYDDYGTIGGGAGNQAGTDDGNTAFDTYATVGGGVSNTASGLAATVPGGVANTADGDYSFAAGAHAKANHTGAFVWADTVEADFASTANNQFNARATGGFRFWVDTAATGLRLFPVTDATWGATVNVLGGHGGNHATAGVAGATIAGGGYEARVSRVTDHFGTIGGGGYHQAGSDDGDPTTGEFATVGGGYDNEAGNYAATVGGGDFNDATGREATVSGGSSNVASGFQATIGGGYQNTADGWRAFVGGGHNNQASGYHGTVPGGERNLASGQYAFAAGYRAKATRHGSFVWADSTDADFASTADNQFNARATGGFRLWVDTAASGLRLFPVEDVTYGATANVLAGYGGNHATAGVVGATVGGGGFLGASNSVSEDFGTVGGGAGNTASGLWSTVGGGMQNTASNNYATVGGGNHNDATGILATIPGGYENEAKGNYSFAAGQRAKALHKGSFVWADSTVVDFRSLRDDHFHVKASGGVGLNVNGGWMEVWVTGDRLILTSTGAWLSTAGEWRNASDRNAKENFLPVDGREVLARLAELPIATWSHKAQDPSVRHLGPMAQDFHAAFGLGSDDTTIGTRDADGVALAAIQGLHQIVEEKDAEIADLKARLAKVEALIARLASTCTREE